MGMLGIRCGLAAALLGAVGWAAGIQDTGGAVKVADGVWYRHHKDIGKFGSNVGWIEFKDHVVVIDAAFPLGAEEALKDIRATVPGKPVKTVVVTHYHADHSFGLGVFAKEGATIIAHANAHRQYLEKNVGPYQEKAQKDEVYGKYPATGMFLTFQDTLVLDDGTRRAEIRWFGHAHTTGCIFTWLPKEKLVFTGDACVNGPFNYMGDSDSASWIGVLGKVKELGPATVVPGHGPSAKGDLIATQRRYFEELRVEVGKCVAAGKTLQETQASVDLPAWKAWTGESKMSASNIAHVYGELKGK
jgi:glyoxylase-like metal-dependent hydrolase (beta-lactamase superfamily II)